jgi:hypothetical protein
VIDSYIATVILIVTVLLLGVGIPLLDHSKRCKSFISLRWILVVVHTALSLGVILDFTHLNDTLRLVITGGAALLGVLFLILRSIEKAHFLSIPYPKPHVKYTNQHRTVELYPPQPQPEPEPEPEPAAAVTDEAQEADAAVHTTTCAVTIKPIQQQWRATPALQKARRVSGAPLPATAETQSAPPPGLSCE